MNALYALAFLYTQPMVKDLGSDSWAKREAQTQLLDDLPALSLFVGTVNSNHHDPEVQARCRRFVRQSVIPTLVQHRIVFAMALYWPDDGHDVDDDDECGGLMALPDAIDDYVHGYVQQHRRTFADFLGCDPQTILWHLCQYRTNLRPWRNWL